MELYDIHFLSLTMDKISTDWWWYICSLSWKTLEKEIDVEQRYPFFEDHSEWLDYILQQCRNNQLSVNERLCLYQTLEEDFPKLNVWVS